MSSPTTTRAVTSDDLAACFERRVPADAVFAPDGIYDANIPAWRFQIQGPDAIARHFDDANPSRDLRVTVSRSVPTADGFVAELTMDYTDEHGVRGYYRILALAERAGDKIRELALYCTGRWDADTRARHAAEAPMVHP